MGIFGRKKDRPAPDPLPDVAATAPAMDDGIEVQRGPAWRGRGLRLPFPPTPEHAGDLAAVFVDTAERMEGWRLDWSVDSLKWVDRLLDGFGVPGSDATAETVLTAGCYAGEILVRSHGYRWTAPPEEVAHLFFPAVVVGPRGNYTNPIGKAFKLVENGPADSLWFLVHADTAK